MFQTLRHLGAVPFCLTNVSQLLAAYSCSNPIFGMTTHPLDETKTSGGSSGGEASLIAMGGSILGIGSDIGGSLRIPAHFCGISSLKPTKGRIFVHGERSVVKGKVVGIHGSLGFMSKKVDGVIYAMQALLKDPELLMSDLDHNVVPIPWNERLFCPTTKKKGCSRRKLKIGYYTDDGYFPLTPACKRAVEVAIEALDNAKCEIVYFRPPHLETLFEMFADHVMADGGIIGANSLEVLKGEEILEPVGIPFIFIHTMQDLN